MSDTRKLAAILAADVAGFSRLTGIDEEGTLARLRALRGDLLDPTVAGHRGRVVKRTGDGLIVEFRSAVDAVRCAVALQDGMAERNAGIAADRRIDFRIGIHVGDVVEESDGDLMGDAVNIAARLEGVAAPGSICLSEDAYRQVRSRLTLAVSDLGETTLKNIALPMRIFALRVGPDAPPESGPAKAAAVALPDKPSIIVLPFENMSRDPEQEYFSDGITEDIITDLSKARGLFVIARTTSLTYKGRSLPIPEICREVKVRFALEGSIRKAGNRVRITAQLIDGSSGGHVWAERWDRELTDIFAVQDEVTQQIVAAMKVNLSEREIAAIRSGGTRDVAAHDAFLRGRELLFSSRRDRAMFEQTAAHLHEALRLDPAFAAPFAGLAMLYLLDFQNHWSEEPGKSLEVAAAFVATALRMDDADPFSHYVASMIAMFGKDHAGWAREADRALELNPSFAPAMNARGIVHIYTGEPQKAVPYIELGMRLDPGFRQQYLHFLGSAHFVAGDWAEAEAAFRERIALVPETDLTRAFLAATLGHQGRVDEARSVWQELMAINSRYDPAAHIARLPFKHQVDADRFTDGLRKASLVA